VRVWMRDQVEGDVDASGERRDLVGVAVDGLGVERIHDRGLCRPAGGANVAGDALELDLGAPGEKHSRALSSEGPGDRGADRPAASIDHGVLVLEQHVNSSLRVKAERRYHRPGN